jgi:hypothetical protein
VQTSRAQLRRFIRDADPRRSSGANHQPRKDWRSPMYLDV